MVSCVPARLLREARTSSEFQAYPIANLLPGGVPTEDQLAAVSVNITILPTSGGGWSEAWPDGTSPPGTSDNQWSAGTGEADLNGVIPLGNDGSVRIYSQVAADVLIDVEGWYLTNVQPQPASHATWSSNPTGGDAAQSSPTATSAIVGSVNLSNGGVHLSTTDLNISSRGPNLGLTRTYNSPVGTTQATYQLDGNTCVTATNCWAVGYQCTVSGGGNCATGSYQQTLIEQYNGEVWTPVSSPNAGSGVSNELNQVSCTSATNCWAFGEYYASSYWQTLTLQYNGTSWSIVSSPNQGTSLTNKLRAGTCYSATNCWAVGFYINSSGVSQTLGEQYNGTSWSIVSTPNSSTTQANALYGVSCDASNDCWADGLQTPSVWQTLTEHYNGTSWSIVSSANTSTSQNNTLQGISCTSSSNCEAAGFYYNSSGVQQTLAEKYNGSSWSVQTTPNTSTSQLNELWGMTCASASECFAVGYSPNSSGNYQPLIIQYNGTSWSLATVPGVTGAAQNALQGVTCVSLYRCWTVGYWNAGSDWQVLGEEYDGYSWTVQTGSPSVNGPLGYGWSSNIPGLNNNTYVAGTTLTENSANTVVTITDQTGATVTFTLNGSMWTAPAYNVSTLTTSGGNWTYTRWDGYVYTFNSSGLLTSIADRNGNTTSYTYTSGQVTTITDQGGRTLTIGWTGNNIRSIKDPDNQYVYYYYDGSGNLHQVTDQNGNSTYYTYDWYHELLTVSDKLSSSNVVTYAYNAVGQVQSVTDRMSRQTTFSYSEPYINQTATLVTSPTVGSVTPATRYTFTYGLPTQVVGGYGSSTTATTTYIYDPTTLAMFQSVNPIGTLAWQTHDYNGNLLSSQVTPVTGTATTTSATYNISLNEPLTKTDANGNVTDFTYDSVGNLTCEWVGGGTCSSPGFVNGGSTSYTICESSTCGVYGNSYYKGDVETVTDASSATWTRSYDTYGDLASLADPNGNKTTYAYDILGRETSTVTPIGNVYGCGCASANTTSYTYNGTNQVATVVAPSPTGSGTVTTTNAYDANGTLTKVQDPTGNYASSAYDLDGEKCWTLVAASASTNPCSTVPTGAVSDTYDADGNVATSSDANGNATTYAYNALWQKTSATGDAGSSPHLNLQTTRTYDAVGNVLTTVSPNGNVSGCGCASTYTFTNTYDGYNRLLTTKDASNNTVTNTYDGNGNELTTTDPVGNERTNQYDAENRLCWTYVGTSSPSGACGSPPTGASSQTLDGLGAALSSKDPNGNVTTNQFDADHRLCWSLVGTSFNACTTPPTGSTSYTYDVNGRELTTTDPNGNIFSKAYNPANMVCWSLVGNSGNSCGSLPTGASSYTHDANGNLLTSTDPDSFVTTKTYDALNRTCWSFPGTVTSPTCGSAPTGAAAVTYDNASNVVSATDPNGNVSTKAYDAAERLCWSLVGNSSGCGSTPPSGSTAYAYDANGNPVKVTQPDGAVVSEGFDAHNRVCWSLQGNSTNACGSVPSFATASTYDGDGQLLKTQDPNGNYTSTGYNSHGQACWSLVGNSSANCASPPSNSTQYTYDNNGNVLTTTLPTGSVVTNTYDSHNRVCWTYQGSSGTACGGSPPSGSIQYTYDNNGNILTSTDASGNVVTNTHNARGELCWTLKRSVIQRMWDGARGCDGLRIRQRRFEDLDHLSAGLGGGEPGLQQPPSAVLDVCQHVGIEQRVCLGTIRGHKLHLRQRRRPQDRGHAERGHQLLQLRLRQSDLVNLRHQWRHHDLCRHVHAQCVGDRDPGHVSAEQPAELQVHVEGPGLLCGLIEHGRLHIAADGI